MFLLLAFRAVGHRPDDPFLRRSDTRLRRVGEPAVSGVGEREAADQAAVVFGDAQPDQSRLYHRLGDSGLRPGLFVPAVRGPGDLRQMQKERGRLGQFERQSDGRAAVPHDIPDPSVRVLLRRNRVHRKVLPPDDM
ncbi:MAG: hypothetical protein BJ554DRAFT_881 [Olpidium bornovanus]|uniref:Uncharacterized protein n=1 Tax=Olpidium bornovanus TaxID=278681 RepID=A0A8H7ZTC2_9FUNG|nr:MAG: hypothetical protein BJ554DRAFT_881 [Olpidium bornovanus]